MSAVNETSNVPACPPEKKKKLKRESAGLLLHPSPECCGNKEPEVLGGRMANQWEQAGDGPGGGGRGHGVVGEWEQKGARSGKLRRSLVGETSLFGGENKGEGELMEEA